MVKDLVSVVVPIYNVEKYLNRCLESIVAQTYQNLEIILVDDGSPDGCPQLCEDWAKKDTRIKVIHKENAGLGMARNTGIENAAGEFICFFDSDDYIAPETIQKCITAITAEQADVVAYGMLRVNQKGTVIFSGIPQVQKRIFSGTEVQDTFLADMISADPNGGGNTGLCMSASAAMVSMQVIQKNNWRFVSERTIISEDTYSLLSLYRDVEKVVVLEESFYYYCENSSSLTHKYRPDRYQKIQHFYQESLSLCQRLGYSDKIKHRLSRLFIAFSIAALKQEAAASRPFRDRFTSVKAIAQDDMLREAVRFGKGKIDGAARKILFFSILHKLYGLCFLLSRLKK